MKSLIAPLNVQTYILSSFVEEEEDLDEPKMEEIKHVYLRVTQNHILSSFMNVMILLVMLCLILKHWFHPA